MRIRGVPAGGGISYLRGQYEQPLKLLMVVAGLVLLTACSNIANLLIARGRARRHEIAVRVSLGAGRVRVLQQLLTESLLLASLSAGAGLLVAHWATPILIGLLTASNEPAQLVTSIDLRLFAFTFLLTLLTVVICGLLPAIRLANADAHLSLKGGPRVTAGRGEWARHGFVAAQVALSLVLIVGAGLFTRTLVNLLSSSLGFTPKSVLIARISFAGSGGEDAPFRAWSRLLQRVRAFPGLEYASLSFAALFAGDAPMMGVRTTPVEAPPADPLTSVSFISTDYFSTLGVGFLSGRDFNAADGLPSGPPVAIVNRAFARKFFADENPLGRKLTKMANAPDWTEIVGVVHEVKVNSLRDAAPPMVYIPYRQITNWLRPESYPGFSMFLQMRAQQNAPSLAAELRRQAGAEFKIGEISRQQQLIDDTLVRERLLADVSSVLGGLAVLLAGLGLYAIVSYAVVRRRQELGIRMALGAQPAAILGLILRDSAMVVGVGILVGVLLAGLGSRWIETLLFGLPPNDVETFIVASILLLAVAFSASVIPAYRAAETDPMLVLRHE